MMMNRLAQILASSVSMMLAMVLASLIGLSLIGLIAWADAPESSPNAASSVEAKAARDAQTAAGTEPATGLLRLVGGDHIPGQFARDGSADKTILPWQHQDFQEPFQFELSRVFGVSFATDGDPQLATGRFVFELTAGDRVFGEVLRIDDSNLDVRTAELGDITIARSELRQL